MKLRLTLTRLAKLDLDDLIVHIGKDNPRAAVKIGSSILDKIELLRDQPEMGRRGRRPGTRELVVEGTRYIVVYRVVPERDQIQILRILHAARLWPEQG